MPAKRAKRGRNRKATAARPRSHHAAIRRALLTWFSAHAADLPWRGTSDPYAIWVSEVMLQQTQIATVTPFYHRFLEAFPTLTHLARAPLERVLELWSGLGYYRRARHLHHAAQILVQQHDARFPQDYDGLRTLPGIGDYTARAVLSIAFHQPYAVLDGNVARVVARLCAMRGNLHQLPFRRAVEAELERLLSPQAPGDFNQAMMELGQTICLPRGPRCSQCPVAKRCEARQSGDPEAFPLPRPRRATESLHLAVALLRSGTRVALWRGLEEGLLDDLWNFPSAFGSSTADALEALRQKLADLASAPAAAAADGNGEQASYPGSVRGHRGPLRFTFGEPIAEFRHTITFRAIRGTVYPVETTREIHPASWQWFELADLPQAAISQLVRKILHKVV